MQSGLWVTGYKKWHFWSYHPEFNPLHIVVEPDVALHHEFDVKVAKFLDDLDAAVESIGEADILKKYKDERYQSDSLPWEEFDPAGDKHEKEES